VGVLNLLAVGDPVLNQLYGSALDSSFRAIKGTTLDSSDRDWNYVSLQTESFENLSNGLVAVRRTPGANEYNIGGPGFAPGYTPCGFGSPRGSSGLSFASIGKDDYAANTGECKPAYSYKIDSLQGQFRAVIARTVLVTSLGTGLTVKDDGQISAAVEERPCANGLWSNVYHCSGFLMNDNITVLTALHCIESFSSINANDFRTENEIECPSEGSLRFVASEGLNLSGELDSELITSCESITKIGDDLVHVRLSREFGNATLLSSTSGVSGLYDDASRIELIDGLPLFSAGFPQVKFVQSSIGGRLVPVRYCLDALNYVAGPVANDFSREALEYKKFGCVSVDTLNGMSGGPVFAIHERTNELSLIGAHVAAFEIGGDLECRALTEVIVPDTCGSDTTRYNLIEYVR
jgi:hypothetical protein